MTPPELTDKQIQELQKIIKTYGCEKGQAEVCLWDNGRITCLKTHKELYPLVEKNSRILLPYHTFTQNDSFFTTLKKALELREFFSLTIQRIKAHEAFKLNFLTWNFLNQVFQPQVYDETEQ